MIIEDTARQEFINGVTELQRTNVPGYLGVYAILLLPGDSERTQPPAGYSRNDFKRAIRLLRIYQHSCPEQGEHAESAIALIRRDWLHRGDKEQQAVYVAQVVQEARETFPELFAGKTEQEIINKIAEVEKKYAHLNNPGAANQRGGVRS